MKSAKSVPCAALFALLFVWTPDATAWNDDCGLATRVRRLELENVAQQTQIDRLAAIVGELRAQVDLLSNGDLVALDQKLYVIGDTVFIEGANLHIRNGMGLTGTVNGLGNLVLGYDETDDDVINGVYTPDAKTGSHNLVVGRHHSYASYGGIAGGEDNRISGTGASVVGGIRNIASGAHAAVSGGAESEAGGAGSSVGGGNRNLADGDFSSVTAGFNNRAAGSYASVTGGTGNQAAGGTSSIERANCQALGNLSSINGGRENSCTGTFATVSGGRGNDAAGSDAVVGGGGYQRTAVGTYDWRAGGLFQTE